MSWPWWWRHPYQAHKVILNFKNDAALPIEGVLYQTRGPWLILRQAAALRDRGGGSIEAKPIDGEIMVHRSDIAFYQL